LNWLGIPENQHNYQYVGKLFNDKTQDKIKKRKLNDGRVKRNFHPQRSEIDP
jgi:hypothetical protein